MTMLRLKILVAAVSAQALLLLWIYLSSLTPFLFGEEVRLQAEGIDPRSMFRGNYARLVYPITSKDNVEQGYGNCAVGIGCIHPYKSSLRQNEIIYIKLKDCASGLCGNGGVVLDKPDEGLYLRARWSNGAIRLPRINAWFAPREEALHIEREYNAGNPDKLIVVLRVLPDSGMAGISHLQTTSGSTVYSARM